MKLNYYAIFDSKTKLYGQLFPAHTHGAAERSFNELINNSETQQSKYSEDFSLYFITEFDDELAIFTPSTSFKLVEAVQLKK